MMLKPNLVLTSITIWFYLGCSQSEGGSGEIDFEVSGLVGEVDITKKVFLVSSSSYKGSQYMTNPLNLFKELERLGVTGVDILHLLIWKKNPTTILQIQSHMLSNSITNSVMDLIL